MDINRDNYESFLLSYLDGELTQNDKESAEKFLAENTDLQKEFSALKSVRLIPDEIYFDDKQLLLRTGDKRRVLPLYWLRMAAVLMLGVAGTWLIWMSRHQNNTNPVTTENPRPVAIVSSNDPLIADNKKTDQVIVAEKNENGEAKKRQDIKKRYASKTDISTAESTEEIADIQKSRINMQPESTLINPVVETRALSGPEMKTTSMVAASVAIAANNSSTISSVSQPEDQSEDVSISVLSISAKNKPATGFFKKLLKNTGSDKSGRTVNVSVLQINY